MQIDYANENNQKSNFELRLSNRFKDQNLQYFSSYFYNNPETIIIKVKLNRAVLEYITSFKNYMQNKLALNNDHYIIDLSDALFMDSTFLGSIVSNLKLIKAKGATLSLVIDLNKVKILSYFENLQSIMNIYPTLELAKAQLHH